MRVVKSTCLCLASRREAALARMPWGTRCEEILRRAPNIQLQVAQYGLHSLLSSLQDMAEINTDVMALHNQSLCQEASFAKTAPSPIPSLDAQAACLGAVSDTWRHVDSPTALLSILYAIPVK
jgi:hypothetical protein